MHGAFKMYPSVFDRIRNFSRKIDYREKKIAGYAKHEEMLGDLMVDTHLDAALIDPFAYNFFKNYIEEKQLKIVGNIPEPSAIGNINSNLGRGFFIGICYLFYFLFERNLKVR